MSAPQAHLRRLLRRHDRDDADRRPATRRCKGHLGAPDPPDARSSTRATCRSWSSPSTSRCWTRRTRGPPTGCGSRATSPSTATATTASSSCTARTRWPTRRPRSRSCCAGSASRWWSRARRSRSACCAATGARTCSRACWWPRATTCARSCSCSARRSSPARRAVKASASGFEAFTSPERCRRSARRASLINIDESRLQRRHPRRDRAAAGARRQRRAAAPVPRHARRAAARRDGRADQGPGDRGLRRRDLRRRRPVPVRRARRRRAPRHRDRWSSASAPTAASTSAPTPPAAR